LRPRCDANLPSEEHVVLHHSPGNARSLAQRRRRERDRLACRTADTGQFTVPPLLQSSITSSSTSSRDRLACRTADTEQFTVPPLLQSSITSSSTSSHERVRTDDSFDVCFSLFFRFEKCSLMSFSPTRLLVTRPRPHRQNVPESALRFVSLREATAEQNACCVPVRMRS